MAYLIYKEGEKLNDFFLTVYALLISTLGGKIDTLAETIYEVFFSQIFQIFQIENWKLKLY